MSKQSRSSTHSKSQVSDDIDDPEWIGQIWNKLKEKLNNWMTSSLPLIVKDLFKSISDEVVKQHVDTYVSSKSFQKSLNASLEFDASKLRQNISWMESEVDAAKNKISDLADENDRPNNIPDEQTSAYSVYQKALTTPPLMTLPSRSSKTNLS